MEYYVNSHHILVMKKLLLSGLFVLSVLIGHAQKAQYCTSDNLTYDFQTKLTKYRDTKMPFTGYEYALSYYYRDTSYVKYIRNGRLEWQRSYGNNKKLTAELKPYYGALKNDSICMEQISYSEQTGDTNGYIVHYLDKDRIKWSKQYVYHYSYSNTKPKLRLITTSRFYTKSDTKNFLGQDYRLDANYDSAGYYNISAYTGKYIEYYESGAIMIEGAWAAYEYCVAHKGVAAPYPSNGRVGLWKYYTTNGVLLRDELYALDATTVEHRYYYPNGRVQTKSGYSQLFSAISVPSKAGLNISRYDTCKSITTTWYEDGKIMSESFTTPKGELIQYAFHLNGQPSYISAITTATYKPFAIHKKWDLLGKVIEFVNYSVENNDTLCYRAENGRIVTLNLKARGSKIEWAMMSTDVYGNRATLHAYLYNKATITKQFFPNGKLRTEINLVNGVRNGAYSQWDSSGVQLLKGNYVNGMMDGEWFEWYTNGKPRRIVHFQKGIRHGSCMEYYANGALKWENTYNNGQPGIGKAYSENETLLRESTYLDGFYPARCINEQKRAVATTSLHYYLLDTGRIERMVTLSDSVLANYGITVVAGLLALSPEFDLCAPAEANNYENGNDAYRSSFAISASAYDDSAKIVINAFFARHGIHIDKSAVLDPPQLGLEKEYIVNYSSKQILNKPLIIDSLEILLLDNSSNGKNGYIIALDANQPSGGLAGFSNSVMTSENGYSVLKLQSMAVNRQTGVRETVSKSFIIYDDLTSDFYKEQGSPGALKYWALNNPFGQ